MTANTAFSCVGIPHIDYGRVMQIMGQITAGGFTHVALLAQQPPGGH